MLTLTLVSALLVLLSLASSAYGAHPHRINPHRQKVVRNLDRGLSGTPMANTGRELEAAGHKHGVNPAFIAAVAGVESSYGAAACRSNRHNAFGLGSCSGSWVPFFPSWASAYGFMARFIASRWSTSQSPWSIGRTYCPPCGSSWGDRVASFMRRFGSSSTVAYR